MLVGNEVGEFHESTNLSRDNLGREIGRVSSSVRSCCHSEMRLSGRTSSFVCVS